MSYLALSATIEYVCYGSKAIITVLILSLRGLVKLKTTSENSVVSVSVKPQLTFFVCVFCAFCVFFCT